MYGPPQVFYQQPLNWASEMNPFEQEDYYDNVWDEYDYGEGEEAPYKKPARRINFSQYGNSSEGKNETNGEELPANIYCDLIDTLNKKCFQFSLLEMWQFNEAYIETATQQEIIDAVIHGGAHSGPFLKVSLCQFGQRRLHQHIDM